MIAVLQSVLIKCSRSSLNNLRSTSFSTAKEYDLVVIGAGPGGYVAAIRAAQLGLKTACVEKRGSLGGTCLNVGCIPSKALLHNSHLFHTAKHDFAKRGIEVPEVSINLKSLLAYKDKNVTQLTKGIEYLFKKNKVDSVQGAGRFINNSSLEVSNSAGVKSILTAKNFIIATGSEPMAFPGVAIDEKSIVSSTGALSFSEVPKKLVIIGGGIIGLELGSVWSRLGSEVTVIEFLDHIGAGMDIATASGFQKILIKQGLKIRLGTKVTGVTKVADGEYQVHITPAKGNGDSENLLASAVLISIGRKPNTENLGLDTIGIKTDGKGRILTNSQYCTNFSNIRAIGDVIVGPMLAHKAEEEGITAVNMIAQRTAVHDVNYEAIPSVIYTHPEVAWVGKTEEQLKLESIPYIAGVFPFMANSRAKTNDDMEGFVKVLAHEQTGQVLGCHIIGPNAGEMIAEATVAIHTKIKAEDLANTCHAHPTLSEAFKEACMSVSDLRKPIHF